VLVIYLQRARRFRAPFSEKEDRLPKAEAKDLRRARRPRLPPDRHAREERPPASRRGSTLASNAGAPSPQTAFVLGPATAPANRTGAGRPEGGRWGRAAPTSTSCDRGSGHRQRARFSRASSRGNSPRSSRGVRRGFKCAAIPESLSRGGGAFRRGAGGAAQTRTAGLRRIERAKKLAAAQWRQRVLGSTRVGELSSSAAGAEAAALSCAKSRMSIPSARQHVGVRGPRKPACDSAATPNVDLGSGKAAVRRRQGSARGFLGYTGDEKRCCRSGIAPGRSGAEDIAADLGALTFCAKRLGAAHRLPPG